jgi:phage internal scaffolding protein
MSLKLVKDKKEVSMSVNLNRPVIVCDVNRVKVKVQQNLAAQCDINSIIARALKTGVMPVTNKQPLFTDVSGVEDYRSACERALSVDSDFASLSASVRERFHNDPEELLMFIADNANYSEAVKLGLIEPKAVKEPAAGTVPVAVAPAAEAAKTS